MSAGSRSENLVVIADFGPTFADLVGVAFSGDGSSLAPFLYGEEPACRSVVILERLNEEDRGGGKGNKGKGKGRGGQPAFETTRTETHRYVEYDNGETELYDLEADPYELKSTHVSAEPSLAEDPKASLRALRSCSEAGRREAEGAP